MNDRNYTAHAESTRIGVEVDARDRAAKKGGTSPVLVVGLLVGAALIAAMVLHKPKGPSLAATMPQAPELLPAAQGCADQGVAAAARATESEQAAIAKAERYAFDAHDGVDAVALYGLAASCYGRAGDAQAARRATASEVHWRTKIEQVYQSGRLRLRLALDRGATAEAYSQAHALRGLLRDHDGAYIEWLTAIERAYKPIEKRRASDKRKKR